jgi:hypothetical protein
VGSNGNGHNPGDWEFVLRSKYKKPPPKMVKAFFGHLANGLEADATKAAGLAGYKFPNKMAHRLKAKFPDVTEACGLAWRDKCGVKPDELTEHLAEIVRDKDHKDRMKAIELNAKIHGMLTEKHVIELDRNSLLTQIDKRLAQLAEARALETGQELPSLPLVTDQESSDFTE